MNGNPHNTLGLNETICANGFLIVAFAQINAKLKFNSNFWIRFLEAISTSDTLLTNCLKFLSDSFSKNDSYSMIIIVRNFFYL